MSRFSPKLPPLKTLEVFESAYRLQSFTLAASELALSQSSVSRRVRELEEDLGCSLFERRRHDVMPTPESHRLAEVVESSLSELAFASEQLRQQGRRSDILTLYSDISLGKAVVLPLLTEYRELNSEVQIKLMSSYVPIESTLDYFDIGLQYGRIAEDRFNIQTIADEIVYPVCSPKFAAAQGADLGLVELGKLPLLHLNVTDRWWPDWYDFFRHHGSQCSLHSTGVEFSSYQVCLNAAELGHGVALGWGQSVKDAIASNKLIRISALSMLLPDAICLYQPKHHSTNPLTENFVKYLVEYLSNTKLVA